MAENKSNRKRSGTGAKRRSGSKSGGTKGSSGRGGSRKSTTRASSRRSPTATKKAPPDPPDKQSPTGGDNDDGYASKAQEAQSAGKEMGRPPADEPDVYVYVPKVHVGELTVDVERLDAHLALRAQVANLVNLVAGVHVGVDKVKIDLKDVDAECELKVRLENTYNILDRTLTTLDENPQVVEKLLNTADTAVQETGQIGREATKPGGAVDHLTSGLGETVGNLGQGIGDTLSNVTSKADPRKLLGSGNGGGGAAKRRSEASANGARPLKAAAAATVVGLAGTALLGARRRGRMRRRTSALHIAKQVGRAGYRVGKTVDEIQRAGKATQRALP